MRGIHPVFRHKHKRILPKIKTAFFAILPLTFMFFIVMEMANALIFMHKLAIACSPVREIRRITADPSLTARCLHKRCCIITTKAAMLAWDWFCFHPIIGHWHPRYLFLSSLARQASSCLFNSDHSSTGVLCNAQ